MKVTGSATLDAPAEKVWDSILDPNVLVRTIPGCERLEETGEHEYSAAVTAGVASIKGTYQGKVKLSDLKPHESLVLHAEGASAAGTIGVDVQVTFKDLGNGTTQIDYDADAVVGGMIGGVGQRMLTSVSKRISNEFFGNVNKVLTGQMPVEAAPAAAPSEADVAAGVAAPKSYGAPAPVASVSDGQDLLKGLVAGAIIALIGVVVGAVAARRR
ncbi:MAG: carbon monoxide dehydrogenase subunit G [Actinomycetales bacterium]|nr:carbon monoxide dehydrogenase subunit G [Actinomycetales bacterium]